MYLPFESLLVFYGFAFRQAGILPIAKVLKRDSVIIRFMLHARQNGELSTERVGIEE
jgi:hypothetical protein